MCVCVLLYLHVCVNVCDQHLCLFCYLLSFSPCDVRLLAFFFLYLHTPLCFKLCTAWCKRERWTERGGEREGGRSMAKMRKETKIFISFLAKLFAC